ncbi:metallophosphoesterase family protein [Haloferula chungangensis]|uniref:Metallophosphoesterase family protein n=1 Tax=Haloferula chungangensis TaxID=1048331 RepID=A0ABW2L9K5_9BACT
MTRLMQLSDIHFGAEIPAAVEALIEVTERLQPDRVLIGGDFTMRARRREWQAAREFIERLPVATLSIPGNHDIPGANDLWDRFFTPWVRYREAISEDLEPSEIIGDVEVVGLNTARRFGAPSFDWSRGAVSVAQCLGLPMRFTGETPLRAVMIHHPLLAPSKGDRRLLKRDGMLLAALETAKVDLLLAGHYHQSHVAAIPLPLGEDDMVLSHVSTACSWRTKGEPPGFHLIGMEAGKIELVRFRFAEDAGRFEEWDRLVYGKRGRKWVLWSAVAE